MKQTLTITDWLPEALSNVHADHWRKRERKLKAAQRTVWTSGRQAGLQPVAGRVCVTIELVFAQKRRRDTDNLYARVKGVVDGLVKGGWIEDDNSGVLDLRVLEALSMNKRKSTRITIEPLAAGRSDASEDSNMKEGE